MKTTLLFLSVFLTANLFGQQLSFKELIYYAKDSKKFEQRMFSLGNTIIDIDRFETYGFSNAEGYGASVASSIPTNNPYYDEKWLFPSGEIFTSSQIKAKGLDDYDEIRQKLIKSGQPLNKDSISGFHYGPYSEIYKNKNVTTSFGQNYNKENETALTFYNLKVVEREKIYPDKKPSEFWSSRFNIFFTDRDTYLKALREVQSVCEYIKTSKQYGENYFNSEYQYGSFTVTTYETGEYGGHINIYVLEVLEYCRVRG